MNKETVKGKMKKMETEGNMREGIGKMKDAGREVVDKVRNIGNKQGKDLPEEDYQDVRNRKNAKADVVPDRDDEIGEQVPYLPYQLSLSPKAPLPLHLFS